MRERVKIITFASGHGETVVGTPNEEHVNQWLAATPGELVSVTQSESYRPGGSHHVTVCLWYLPENEAAPS
jgi:hypothetical protein